MGNCLQSNQKERTQFMDNMSKMEIAKLRDHMKARQEKKRVHTIFDAIYNSDLNLIKCYHFTKKEQFSKRKNGKSPLYYAAEYGESEIVKWIANEVDNIDINDGESITFNTPLHIACSIGWMDIVEVLLLHPNCNNDKANRFGQTPLHTACQYGHTEIVQMLLTRPDIAVNRIDNEYLTPIIIAAHNKHQDIVRLLMNHQDIAKGTKVNRNLFTVACLNELDDIVRIMIEESEYKIRIGEHDFEDHSLLHIAAKSNFPNITEIIKIYQSLDNLTIDFLDHWENIELDELIPNEIRNKIQAFCGESLFNKSDNYGKTPLFYVCERGNLKAFDELFDYPGIRISNYDKSGCSILHAACRGGSIEIIRKLLTKIDNSELNGSDNSKRTPFYIACKKGWLEVVEKLMGQHSIHKYNININQQDSSGKTPLFIAIEERRFECARLLCDNDAVNINTPSNAGQTPLEIAISSGEDPELIDKLSEREDLNLFDKTRAIGWRMQTNGLGLN